MIVLKPKYIAINSAIFAAISPLSTISFANNTNLPVVNLDPITVTSTRAPSKVSDVIAQTTVIDEQDLQRYQGQTVLDVLRKQPGISFYQNGGTGTVSNFYLRGYDSKQVLVLIDGIRYSSLSSGQPAINLLPTEQIERIEILHGASGSSIYGADAMGGVIQIFTKSGDYNQFSVTAGAGSNDHYLYGVNGTIANDDTSLTLSATHKKQKALTLPCRPTVTTILIKMALKVITLVYQLNINLLTISISVQPLYIVRALQSLIIFLGENQLFQTFIQNNKWALHKLLLIGDTLIIHH